MSFIDRAIGKVSKSKFAEKARSLVGESGSKRIADTANKALTILTSPIQSISNFKKAQEQTDKKSALRLLAEGAEVALTATTPFTATGKKVVAKVAGAAFKTIPRGVATTTALGAAIASPTIREAAANIISPVENIARGEKIGEFVENLPEEIKGSVGKVAATLPILGGVAALGAAVPLVVDYFNKDDGNMPTLDESVPNYTGVGTSSPITAQTQSLTPTATKTTRKRYYPKKKKSEGVRVSQRVNVIVNNRQITKKYLKNDIY